MSVFAAIVCLQSADSTLSSTLDVLPCLYSLVVLYLGRLCVCLSVYIYIMLSIELIGQ